MEATKDVKRNRNVLHPENGYKKTDDTIYNPGNVVIFGSH